MRESELLSTFEQADAFGPYKLAGRWADIRRQPLPVAGADDGVFVPSTVETELDQVATMAALASWLRRWLPIHLHRSLLAGASVQQVAAACGTSPVEIAVMWREWAAGQRHLQRTIPDLPDDAAEYDEVETLLDAYLAANPTTGGTER